MRKELFVLAVGALAVCGLGGCNSLRRHRVAPAAVTAQRPPTSEAADKAADPEKARKELNIPDPPADPSTSVPAPPEVLHIIPPSTARPTRGHVEFTPSPAAPTTSPAAPPPASEAAPPAPMIDEPRAPTPPPAPPEESDPPRPKTLPDASQRPNQSDPHAYLVAPPPAAPVIIDGRQDQPPPQSPLTLTAPSAPAAAAPAGKVMQTSTSSADPTDALTAAMELAARSPADPPVTPQGAYGHTDGYRSLTGQVQQWRNTWRLRYAAVEADDPHGGSVVLTGSAELEKLRDGQRVRVRGTLLPADDRQGSARYQVKTLDVLE